MSLSSKQNAGRVAQLRELLKVLAKKLDSDPGSRDMANLAKQYRETLAEIEDLEPRSSADPIEVILSDASQKKRIVRPRRDRASHLRKKKEPDPQRPGNR